MRNYWRYERKIESDGKCCKRSSMTLRWRNAKRKKKRPSHSTDIWLTTENHNVEQWEEKKDIAKCQSKFRAKPVTIWIKLNLNFSCSFLRVRLCFACSLSIIDDRINEENPKKGKTFFKQFLLEILHFYLILLMLSTILKRIKRTFLLSLNLVKRKILILLDWIDLI